MSNTAVQKCAFFEGEMFKKKPKKRFPVKDAILGFIKNMLNSQKKDFKLIQFSNVDSLGLSCLCKHVPFSHVNGSSKNNVHYNSS